MLLAISIAVVITSSRSLMKTPTSYTVRNYKNYCILHEDNILYAIIIKKRSV